MGRMTFCFISASFLVYGCATSALDLHNGRPRVVSGDTLVLFGTRVQLWGVEAPDLLQGCYDGEGKFYRCGEASGLFLQQLIDGQQIECRSIDVVEKTTASARCTLAGKDIAEAMVLNGHAVVREGVSGYQAAEMEAKREKRGLWKGRFLRPADWRAKRRPPIISIPN